MAQSIIANTVIATGGRAINVALGIVILGILYRLLGATAFGMYATILACGAIIQILADAGLYLTLTRSIAEQPAMERAILSRTVSLRLVLLLAFFGLASIPFFVIPALQPLRKGYWLVVFGYIAQSQSQLLMGVFQKYGLIWRATAGDIFGRLVQLLGLLALSFSQATNLETAAGLFSISAFAAFVLHYYVLPRGVKPAFTLAWPAWREMLVAASPLSALLVLNAIHFRIDLILLYILRSAPEAGLYGVAYRLLDSLLFLPAMFSGLLLPRLTAAWQSRAYATVREYLTQGLKLMLWLAVFVSMSLFYLAEPILALVSGQASTAATPLLRLLAISLLPLFIGNVCGFVLVASHQQKTLLRVALITTTINIALNLLLIPSFGATAAAVATLCTEALAATMVFVVTCRLTALPLGARFLGRLTLAAAALLALYYYLPATWALFVTLSVGGVLYVAVSVLIRLISRANFSALLKAA